MTSPRAGHLDRRRALGVAATIGLSAPLLAACGDDATDSAADPGENLPTGNTDPELASGTTITTTKEVPVGGGTIFADQEVVVTQPTKGEFHCFTAVCTHMGCIVSSIQAGGIRCECHGSAYSIEDGTPVNPPATEPLEEFPITVKDGTIAIT
jgi:nitrite reductase/ring-hydroxylating ferredoxin subunit